MAPTIRTLVLVASAGLCAALFQSHQAAAQFNLETCLISPEPACVDPITEQIVRILRLTAEPGASAQALSQLAVTLAEGGHVETAGNLLYHLQDPPDRPGLRDTALLEVITVLDAESVVIGRRLMRGILDQALYERARAIHISNLVRHGTLERALEDLVATDRAGQPIQFIGLDSLAVALASDGRTDLALHLINENSFDDLGQRGSLLNNVVSQQIYTGRLDSAQEVLDGIEDPTWRVIAGVNLGQALTLTGDLAAAETAFAQARWDLSGLPDPDLRFNAFEVFVRAALSSDRVDLAIATVPEISSYRFDRVNALNVIAQFALDMEADIDVSALLHTALAELEAGPQLGEPVGERFNQGLAQLAQTMAMAGETDWAMETLARVHSASSREQDMSDIVQSLIRAQLFDRALTFLAAQTDFDMQAQGLIALSRAADAAGQDTIADRAWENALGLVEGPQWVPLNDYTITQMSELDASRGYFDIAEVRLRYVDDTVLQRLSQIAILGFVARSGTDEEVATYISTAQTAVAEAGDRDFRIHLARNMVMALADADRNADALRVALEIPEADVRNATLGTLATALSWGPYVATAMDAANAISDPVLRQNQVQMVWLAALRRSLGL